MTEIGLTKSGNLLRSLAVNACICTIVRQHASVFIAYDLDEVDVVDAIASPEGPLDTIRAWI